MNPATQAALEQRQVTIFGAVQITLPSATLRLLDGAGVVNIGGNLFSGRDDTYGTLVSIDDIEDGASDEAPDILMTIRPPTSAAAAALANANVQQSPVKMWLGVFDPGAGTIIGDTELLFDGYIDTATLKLDRQQRDVEIKIVSIFDRFFDVEQGNRLSGAFHSEIWPGEKGLDFVTGVTERVYWGVKPPPGGPAQRPAGLSLPGIRVDAGYGQPL